MAVFVPATERLKLDARSAAPTGRAHLPSERNAGEGRSCWLAIKSQFIGSGVREVNYTTASPACGLPTGPLRKKKLAMHDSQFEGTHPPNTLREPTRLSRRHE